MDSGHTHRSFRSLWTGSIEARMSLQGSPTRKASFRSLWTGSIEAVLTCSRFALIRSLSGPYGPAALRQVDAILDLPSGKGLSGPYGPAALRRGCLLVLLRTSHVFPVLMDRQH